MNTTMKKIIKVAGFSMIGLVAGGVLLEDVLTKKSKNKVKELIEQEVKKYDWGDYKLGFSMHRWSKNENIYEGNATRMYSWGNFMGLTTITPEGQKGVTFFMPAMVYDKLLEILIKLYGGYEHPESKETHIQFLKDTVAHEWRHTQQIEFLLRRGLTPANVVDLINKISQAYDYLKIPIEIDARRYARTHEEVPMEKVFEGWI